MNKSIKDKINRGIVLSEEEVRYEIKKYFAIKELVGSKTHKKFGEKAWMFLDYRLLYALLIVRVFLNKSITVNYGRKKQRGLRSISQQIVKNKVYQNKLYLSAHLMGKAVDFDVEDYTADSVREWILRNKNLFPFKIRLEGNTSWVHLDVFYDIDKPKVSIFYV